MDSGIPGPSQKPRPGPRPLPPRPGRGRQDRRLQRAGRHGHQAAAAVARRVERGRARRAAGKGRRMISKGQPMFAVMREDPATGYFEVLSCGSSAPYAEAKMDDYRTTSSGKTRRVSLVRLAVEEVVEEFVEAAVREE